MKNAKLVVLLLSIFLFSGCSSKLMQPTASPLPPLPEGQAEVIFYRSSILGGGVQAVLCKADTTTLELIGISSTKTKIVHRTNPGNHTFLVTGESGQLLTAQLEPNKRYLVRISPAVGWLKARFEFTPVTPAEWKTESVLQTLSKCTFVTTNQDTQAWFVANKASIEEKYESALKKRAKGTGAILPANYGIDK